MLNYIFIENVIVKENSVHFKNPLIKTVNNLKKIFV